MPQCVNPHLEVVRLSITLNLDCWTPPHPSPSISTIICLHNAYKTNKFLGECLHLMYDYVQYIGCNMQLM